MRYSMKLPKKQRSLLEMAGNRVVERRTRNGHTFDELVRLGLLATTGKITITGMRTLRRIKKDEKSSR